MAGVAREALRETPRARQAWADYVAMGPGRSLEALLKRYQSESNPVTNRLATLKKWSVVYQWQARLAAIAEQEAREAEEREATERRAVMEEGYALGYRRVRDLKVLAERLFAELTAEGDDNRLWVRDVKQIGGGQYAERVDIERFNAAEVEQLRGLLSDIAKEIERDDLERRVAALEEAAGMQGLGSGR